MKSHNHRELCEIGAKLLKRPESANGHGCHFAIVEPSCYGENPDVFGIRHGDNNHGVGTVLLEAKTSRSDFLADRKKPHRMNPEMGVGKWRYFICPVDLIKPEELPHKWGLIYVNSRGHCKIIAGALSVPQEKYFCEWSKKTKSFRNQEKIIASFLAHSFSERNTNNEFNLLGMALARLDDAESILYMQREFNNRAMKLQTLQHENHTLQTNYNHAMRKLESYNA